MNTQNTNGTSKLKAFGIKWLFGLDTPQDVSTPLGRWIVRPIKKGISFFLIGIIAVYVVLCFWDGYAWSTQISPTYGLRIIRLLVVAILAIIDAVILPFRAGSFLLFMVLNAAILFPFVGILHGLSLSLYGEDLMRKEKNIVPTILFFVGMGVLVFSYGTAILEQDFSGLIDDYIFSSMNIMVPFALGILIWTGRNIYYSIRARHSDVFPASESE
jgi:hypothetical protein